MTVQNIMAGFKSTGIYPFNRHAIVLPGGNGLAKFGTPTAVLAKKNGIMYMPFYSPAHACDTSQHDDSQVFTSDELQHFEHHYEEGYMMKSTTSGYNFTTATQKSLLPHNCFLPHQLNLSVQPILILLHLKLHSISVKNPA